MKEVLVIGAGVAGLATAATLAERGVGVRVVERSARLGETACSWLAGGMLAPYCEGEAAPDEVVALGKMAIDWWAKRSACVARTGTLVVAPPRDASDIDRFARATKGYVRVDEAEIARLEPDLAGRFRRGLFFADEGHLDPRRALAALVERIVSRGGEVKFGEEARPRKASDGAVIDCRGFAARDALPELRGVRGEMLVLGAPDVAITRCVRFLHPRIPLYVVPRGGGVYMVGATMIESADKSGVTVRSAIEMLSAAYALHPAFGEAEILEMRADVRPAFPDNLPRVGERDGRIFVNGFYRHGFLLAPAMAERAADICLRQSEVAA